MLVLTRKVNQEIWIGDIRVVIVERSGSKVRIGIQASPDVGVNRGELGRAACGRTGDGGLLILSRKVGETILIGADCMLTVVQTRGTVQIGVKAPRDVPIVRGELRNAA